VDQGDPPPPPPPPEDDPFRQLLDPGFVERATVREPTAEERVRAARRAAASLAAAAPRAQVAARPELPPARPVRPRRRRRPLVGLGVVVAVAVAVVLAVVTWGPDRADLQATSTTAAGDPLLAAPLKRRPADWPPDPPVHELRPLGRPPEVAAAGPHRFAALQDDGTPVAWDPCRPIRYVVRPGGPAGADLLLRQAIDRVARATGLVFVDEGPTDERPEADRPSYQPERYGEDWAPVLVAWSDPDETPELGERSESDGVSADVAGIGGAASAGWEGEPSIYVTGSLTLDEPDLTALLAQADGWNTVRAVIMHELAHVVGLDHVEDPSQLMHPSTVPGVVEFGAGDLQGLAALGSGPCVPDV
jgi:hypothetical protein